MVQDKEREIRLQFLEEATEYLNTLESAVLGLADSRIDNQKMDAALRAAHSIKGGAAMMGYEALSHLAHRLEDSFKVLKTQRNSLEIDANLESVLLAGVDCLQQVVDSDRSGVGVDEYWIEQHANPIFERLQNSLGTPQEEDASTLLAPEEGQDIVPLLFETEVEGCLQRLESVLADPNLPCLLEEVTIMAQELGGLGEMLQLPAFVSLCESINQYLEVAPERYEEIARLALQAWRRSQALVLIGQLSSLPNQLEVPNFTLPANYPASYSLETEEVATAWSEQEVSATWPDAESLAAWPEPEVAAEIDFLESEVEQKQLSPNDNELLIEAISSTVADLEPATDDTVAVSSATTSISSDVSSLDFRVAERKAEPIPAARKTDNQENTVRVPIKQLEQLNDLFGELTLERNGINLHLERLRNLLSLLTNRVRTLERANTRLRTAYDKVATQAATAPASLVPSIATGTQEAVTNGDPRSSFPDAISYLGGYGTTLAFMLRNKKRSTEGGDSSLSNEHEQNDRLNSISSRFDLLEMDRYNDLNLLSQEVMETIVQIQEVTTDIELSLEDTEKTSKDLNRTAKQMQNSLTQARMRPLSDIVGRFPRALRDLCLEYGKNVELKVYGSETLIERTILEALSAPLMHLLRNAFDHGIEDPALRKALGKSEQGLIEIRAFTRGNQTMIVMSDDGGGIDLGKIRGRAERMGLDPILLAAASEQELLTLIFEPGFSTADQVTSLSGRGVGLDVVRANLKQIRGDIKVDTQPGLGTTFTLTLPFTLSVASIMLVEIHGVQLAFPTDAIEEMVLLNPEQICTTANKEVLNWQGYMVPLVRLGNWLHFNCPHKVIDTEIMPLVSVPTVLMTSQGNQLVGILIDRSWGKQEVAIRQVEGAIPLPPGFSGCTILGDGRVVPLVNPPELLHWVASSAQSYTSASLEPVDNLPLPALQPSHKDTILVVDDSINVRRFLALMLEKAGYQVEQAKDGQEALEKLLNGLQVQAVICDIEMPRLDGYGFLARVKSDPAFSQLPIAMLTSRSGDKHRHLAMTLGATAYFSKPYNEQELLKTLKEVIGH